MIQSLYDCKVIEVPLYYSQINERENGYRVKFRFK